MKDLQKISFDELPFPSFACEVILDKNDKPVDAVYTETNAAYIDFFGTTREQIIGQTLSEAYNASARNTNEAIAKFAKVALTGESMAWEMFSRFHEKWLSVIALSSGGLKVCVLINLFKDSHLDNELKKANYINSLLLDSIPHPTLLIKKDRTVIAANKIAIKQGSLVGGFCWRDWGHSLYLNEEDAKRAGSYQPGKSEIIHCSFCKACDSLNFKETTNVQIKMGDIFWDVYWVPTKEEDVYLHYAIDITETKQKELEIKHLSYHDALTGLYNRFYFEEMLKQTNKESQLPVTIIIGDINGLKLTNDVFGHAEGDKLLQRAAVILKKACRNGDIVARYGGDEFAILLPRTPLEQGEKICRRIKDFCTKNCNGLIPTSISVGCASKISVEDDIYSALKTAEDKMYHQKLIESTQIKDSILASLENALYQKKIKSGDHTARMIKYANQMGSRLSLAAKQMTELNLLARFYDIGIISVDEKILKKKTPLTADEYEQIKKHPEAGYRIARSSPELQIIADTILVHHERWDGCGYPHGLKGEKIPLLARIIQVIDTFTALTSDRPYRKAFTIPETIAELQDSSGKQHDPAIVKVFIALLNREESI